MNKFMIVYAIHSAIVAQAFVPTTMLRCNKVEPYLSRCHLSSSSSSQPQPRQASVPKDRQTEFTQKWLQLEQQALELEENPDDVSTGTTSWFGRSRRDGHEVWHPLLFASTNVCSFSLDAVVRFVRSILFQNASYALAEEMLELALDAVQAAEVDEFHHIARAHHALKKAVNIERDLEHAAHEVHLEVSDADKILESYTNHNENNIDNLIPDDADYRNELMLTSDVGHRVEDYVTSRLHAARAAELEAKQEEDVARENLKQLLNDEKELWAVLGELEALRDYLKNNNNNAKKVQP